MDERKYLETFFDERQLDSRTYEINVGDTTHWIDSGVVIEAILGASEPEQNKIAGIIRRIDLLNGDLHHFLQHLAGALAHQWGTL